MSEEHEKGEGGGESSYLLLLYITTKTKGEKKRNTNSKRNVKMYQPHSDNLSKPTKIIFFDQINIRTTEKEPRRQLRKKSTSKEERFPIYDTHTPGPRTK